ncbi:hypothetical protein [Pseudonocardia aurantiaca]|uniref:Uncharacterized protein n=1 Tax=Pseudonocardia aurantiaca TaxID=75290 RepID=A0ABW4FED1_9PSEU
MSCNTDRNRRHATENFLYGVGAVWVRRGLRRMEHERLLRFLDECWQIRSVVDRLASLDQHDLGGALDQLLGTPDRLSRVD